MPSVAKKLVVVQSNEPAPQATPIESTRPEELRLLEALLFAAGQPLDEAMLARRLPNGVNVKAALAQLKDEYATRGVNLVRVGKKWTFRTAIDLSWLLTKQIVETRKLSRAAIETLAIVAYHQPVTRAEIEEIRGVVAAAGTLDVFSKPAGFVRAAGARRRADRSHTARRKRSSRISGSRKSATCRASTNSRARACWRAICLPVSACRFPRMTRHCATTRSRSIRAISI